MGVSGVLGAVAAPAGLAAAAANTAPVPNPCTIVSRSAALFGGKAIAGTRSTRPDGSVKPSLCTFSRCAVKLQVFVFSHQQSGGFTEGAFDAGVWDNRRLPNTAVLELASPLEAALP